MMHKIQKKSNLILILLGTFLCAATVLLILTRSGSTANFTISNLKVCHLTNPLGIDENVPTFSWQMNSSQRGASQSAYRLTIAESRGALEKGDFLWDSGKQAESQSVGITCQGLALAPKQRYYWQITVWNQDDVSVTSKEEAWFETGLMGQGFSEAKWISASLPEINTSVTKENLRYSIEYHMEVVDTTVSFVFGANEGRYGDMYLCEIENNQDAATFRLKEMCDGYLSEDEFQEVDITTFRSNNMNSFTVILHVEENILSLSVNGTTAGIFSITPTPLGSFGCYKSRGTSYAYLDNLKVTDSQGSLLCQEDFSDSENIFYPYYTITENERLKIGSGLLLTPGFVSPAPLFRREFTTNNQPIESARLYMTALGSFSLSINGTTVSQDYFSPGKFAYNRQLSYATYDVTSFINAGENNALGITLAHGWYDRACGYPEIWNPWGETNALLGALEICYQDGTIQTVCTDKNFLCYTDGPVRENDIYQGEFYDASYVQEGFDQPGFFASGWFPSAENQVDSAYLSLPLKGKANEPISCIQELTPISVTEPVPGVYVYDFGQNFAGTCRIKVMGEQGQIVTLRYGEALNEETLYNRDDIPGTIWTENLLTAEATDYYVLKGDTAGEIFSPEFVYHGFRYLQITGIKEALPIEDVTGLVLSSNLAPTGEFISSNELLNRFYQNTVWSMQSNFMDNPTDCPQRDERHGWAGDAQIFSLTASYHKDTYAFYRKYLEELRLLQSEGGSFPDMAPRNFGTIWDGTGGAISHNCWGDAAIVITWNLYLQYGDSAILTENYDALKSWVDMLVNTSDNYIRFSGGYGDHLSTEDTPADLSDTAWCAHSADLLSRIAHALGNDKDSAYYRQIYENYKTAWQERYLLPEGITVCNTQTSYALGLAFGLFPEEMKAQAAQQLTVLGEYSGYHINTGYSGISYLLPVLSGHGHEDVAYRFLLQENAPSLLHMATWGATTTWESFMSYRQEEDGYRLDGSLNHYAFGSVAGWLYTDALGIQSDESAPGFHHILLTPKPGGGLTSASGSYESVYGKIAVSWDTISESANYVYYFEIPANTTATLSLPLLPENMKYYEGDTIAENAEGVVFSGVYGETMMYELSSGSYCFTAKNMLK